MTVSTAEFLTNIVYAGVYASGFRSRWRSMDGEPPVILAWHDIRPAEANTFRRQVAWLAEHRKVVPTQGVDAQKGGCISLTFDDGLASVARTVAPILNDLGVVGTAFVPTGLLGIRGYLTGSDVAELARGEVVGFGAHSRTHCRLSTLSSSELEAEIRGSKEDLEAIVGRPVDLFCYPFGKMFDVGDTAIRVCSEAGFRLGYSTVRKAITHDCQPLWTPRICVTPRMPVHVLAGLLNGVFWPEDMIASLSRTIKSH